MADELQSWFRQLPGKLQRELAGGFREIVDDVSEELRSEAPEGETGKTRQSVRVRRGRHSLSLVIEAGGALTTKPVREGSGAEYDYALGNEFGNLHVPARPWFYPGWRKRRAGVEKRIEALVSEVVDKA